MKISILLLLLIITSSFVLAARDITISSVQSRAVQPGETTEIRITLENQGDEDIKDISVSLDLLSDDLPFAPIGSAAQKIIEKIKEDKQSSVTFLLATLPDAKPTFYKIPLTIKYEDEDNNDIEEKTIMTIEVISKPELEVAIEESEILKVGDSGEIIIRFVNKGLTDIKFLSVELLDSPDYSLLSPSSFYVGNIEPDDFETVSFKLNINSKVSFLPVNVQYRDSNNVQFSQTELLDIVIYSEEEARALGLIQTSYAPTVISVIILLVIIFFIIRSIRKKRRAKKLNI